MLRRNTDTTPPRLSLALLTVGLVLAFGFVAMGEYFYDDCDEHGAEECSTDCGCVHCVSSISAIQATYGTGGLFDHPRSADLPLSVLPQEESCPGGIDRPPELL